MNEKLQEAVMLALQGKLTEDKTNIENLKLSKDIENDAAVIRLINKMFKKNFTVDEIQKIIDSDALTTYSYSRGKFSLKDIINTAVTDNLLPEQILYALNRTTEQNYLVDIFNAFRKGLSISDVEKMSKEDLNNFFYEN